MATNSLAKYQISFVTYSDLDLIQMIDKGDNLALEFLINKYRNFVIAKSRTYFLVGADRDDLYQEGMIGLYKAIRDYRSDRQTSFRGFADLCITRQIITAIKTATRQKHLPLNSYVSLDKPIYDEDSERTLLDTLPEEEVTNPEELLINREASQYVEIKISEVLSDLEKRVVKLYLEGCSYQEISEKLDRQTKSIDNALQRVKKKLERSLDLSKLSSIINF